EDGIRDDLVTGVQTCALPISTGAVARDPAIVELAATPAAPRPGRAGHRRGPRTGGRPRDRTPTPGPPTRRRARTAPALPCRAGRSASRSAGVAGRRGLAGRAAGHVDREVFDRRRGAAERAIRIAPQPHLAEAHAERVIGEEAAD